MTINPRDYDLDELRKMARQRGNGMSDEDVPDPTGLDMGLDDSDEEVLAGSSFRSGLYRELLPFLGGDANEKPYLETLPETYAAEFVVFEWLEFLLMHSGYQGPTKRSITTALSTGSPRTYRTTSRTICSASTSRRRTTTTN